MFAIYARYRGRDVRRAELVRRSAEALSTLPGIGNFDVIDVEDICATAQGEDAAVAIADVTMALLSAGDWAVGIAVLPTDSNEDEEVARVMAGNALGTSGRSGTVKVRVAPRSSSAATAGLRELKQQANTWAFDISAAFTLLSAVLAKRTAEGREATAFMRRGLTQVEAAEELGITKQAMSQRLQAAGWQAETAGWQLAVDLLQKAELGVC
ncbi:hypothetical protein [Corynebacterium epidermidicanis]|uniref:DNA-binding protein n=1 Tax=Corynebacterium epidermidicanis TaxID=1050174 RepID=A0A0G3GPQ4_9CORY|nr:hypothetical protein [Corynebacterium epidermidicanis]AKK03171.1 hypothetical protein CEPID_06565 [Corynebacterium epidermidicanis]